MHKVHIFAFIFATLSSSITFSQSVDAVLSKIFFSCNLSNRDSSLINFFNSVSNLKLNKDSIGENISVMDSLGEATSYLYKFNSHPTIAQKFEKGELKVTGLKSESKESIYLLELTFYFNTKQLRDSLSNELSILLRSHSNNDFELLRKFPPQFILGMKSKLDNKTIALAIEEEMGFFILYIMVEFIR